MEYEINISKNGLHHFAAIARGVNRFGAIAIYKELKEKYPESKGYKLTLYFNTKVGEEIKVD